MELRRMVRVCVAFAVAGLYPIAVAPAGELRAWGSDFANQVGEVPLGCDYVSIAAGDAHGLALRSDGTVVAWGDNAEGQCNVPSGTYRAIGAGADVSLAIRTDGSIAVWGDDGHGQVSDAPGGGDFVAADGGLSFAVALRNDGSIVAWGDDRWGQVSGTPRESDFVAVVAGDAHAVALRSDGTLAAWGYRPALEGLPTTGTYAAVSAGGNHGLVLRDDGSLLWWGDDPYEYNLADVPAGNDYVGVAVGYLHCLALKNDGSVVGWGAGTSVSTHPNWGQADPPEGTDYAALACGLYFSLGQTGRLDAPVVSDDFDDNRQGDIWELIGDNLSQCWLDETNQRLELRATAQAEHGGASYLGRGWRIDPTADFSFKIDFHYGFGPGPGGWVSVGLTPEVDDRTIQRLVFGAGSDDLDSYFWYELVDDLGFRTNYAERHGDDGVLYVSYDAVGDALYLSTVGYGPDHAFWTLSGVLQDSWGGRTVLVLAGGGTNGLEISSGDAYLDNFAVDSATLLRTGLADVYRFWAPKEERHFYTISESERDKLIDKYADVWTFEGSAFKAAATAYDSGLAPVYRFWSATARSHFYTISESERDKLVKEFADVWTFEGVAFYGYPEGRQMPDAKPVYRFWRPADNTHFYTISESEKQKLIDKYPKVYTFEGVAFYAYPL